MDRVGKSTVCDTNSMGSLQQREEGKLKTLRSVDVWFAFVHFPGRENSYQNIYNVGPIMGELVTLSKKACIGFKMFTLPLPPPPPLPPTQVASVFLPQPQRICWSASGDRENQQYYFGPVITKCRLQTGYKMHSAYKSLGAFETLASDLCINYQIDAHVLFINTLHFLIFLEDQLICYWPASKLA